MRKTRHLSTIPTSTCALVSTAELYTPPTIGTKKQSTNLKEILNPNPIPSTSQSSQNANHTPLPIIIKTYLRSDIDRLSLYNLIHAERTALVNLSTKNTTSGHTPRLLSASVNNTAVVFTMTRAMGIPTGSLPRPLSPARVARIVEQLIHALRDIHTADIVHADINLRNVIIDQSNNDHACLVDFGSCFIRGGPRRDPAKTTCVHVLAPELVDGEQPTPAADVWAIGILVWALVFGGPGPFQCSGVHSDIGVLGKLERYAKGEFKLDELFDRLLTERSELKENEEISMQHVRAFVMMCLQSNPGRRLFREKEVETVDKLLWENMIDYQRMLDHPFIRNGLQQSDE